MASGGHEEGITMTTEHDASTQGDSVPETPSTPLTPTPATPSKEAPATQAPAPAAPTPPPIPAPTVSVPSPAAPGASIPALNRAEDDEPLPPLRPTTPVANPGQPAMPGYVTAGGYPSQPQVAPHATTNMPPHAMAQSAFHTGVRPGATNGIQSGSHLGAQPGSHQGMPPGSAHAGSLANAATATEPHQGQAVPRSRSVTLPTLIISLIVVALVTAMATVGLGYGAYMVWGERQASTSSLISGDKSSTGSDSQSGDKAPLVNSTVDSPDWQAVSKAVRPVTVQIQVVSGRSGDTGSGVIWNTQGDIVTNHHVVAAAQSDDAITVSLYDGRLYHATVVGTDPTTDLAVIRLVDPPKDLVAANLGNSDQLAVGQPVMAIGSPLGYADTVTTGIVSALNRPVAVESSTPTEQDQWGIPSREQPELVITNAIQVDASINPGNSGGPLFNAAGEVIGINSSIASMASSSGSAGSIGLGFAIPVDLVTNVAKQIIEKGEAEHAFMGVTVQNAVATVDGTSRLGAQVASVSDGGPAAQAGIQKGDIVIAINDNDVLSAKSLTGFVRRYNSGDQVSVKVVRDGKIAEIPVTLQARVDNDSGQR